MTMATRQAKRRTQSPVQPRAAEGSARAAKTVLDVGPAPGRCSLLTQPPATAVGMTDAQRRKPMTSRPEILAKRITPTLLLLAVGGALVMAAPRPARANGCKPDGQRCATDVSCCSRTCMKPAPPPGKAK